MKKIIASFMTMCMFLSCNGMALAADVDPFASLTLSRYVVAALSGDSRGEIIISFNVKSSKPLATLGVESIDFYTKDGDFVDSVSGSTSNGLVRTNSSIHNSDFVYDLHSGEYYYAEVTVFAQVGSEYDSRTVTTSTVWVR